MKTVKIAGLITILLITIPSCTADDKNTGALPVILTGFPVVAGNNKFALELYSKINEKQGNLFLSPYSISTALAMTYAGAKSETEKQMADTLCFSTMSSEQLHEEFGSLIRKLNAAGEKGGYELVVANAIWGQKGYNFLPEFLTLVKTNYDGNLEQVDFKTQAEAARKTINAWVEKKTKDKIKELIKPKMLDSTTRLVLTNAIYFKGKWANQFMSVQTKDAPFTLLGGQKVNVPMMYQTEKFGYKEVNNIQVLEMPYVNNDLSMVVLLPKKLDGISELEKDLNNDNLARWIDDLRKRKVQVFFPRFKMTSEFELARVLGAMGMPDAFSAEKADFSGMNGNHELSISAVVHKAYVDVNEEGTEAAAATGVGVIATSIESPPPVFRADHPFIFLIRDNKSGSILFLGRVANPASKDN
ncbi:MAG: serpin family protein [Sedimentisphaerales bacterium]|jgi:serpin B